MSDQNAGTPRVYLYRHGETEWTINGKHTGTTDVDLTERGRKQVLASGKIVVGAGKLIDPSRVARVFVSPRKRAVDTFELAICPEDRKALNDAGKVTYTDRLVEWDYGLYEGLVTSDILELRKSHGLDTKGPWDIWRDGCEGGESPQQVTDRVDSLIKEIREIHAPNMHGEKPADVVLFAHGHLLRAFVKRWLSCSMDFPLTTMLEPGAVGALSYEHRNMDTPAVLVGVGFPLDPSDA